MKRLPPETVETWTGKALSMLRAAGDRRVAEQAQTYFKAHDRVAFLGIKAPEIRAIEKRIHEVLKSCWSVADALQFADSMIQNGYLEAKAVGILFLSRYERSFDERLLATIRGWLAAGHCSNWATTDTLSTCILTPLLRRHTHLLGELSAWTGSDCLWVRRAAAVSLTPLARKGEHLCTAYSVAAMLLGDDEDLMHKAVGWLLRECGKTDPGRLEAFLLAQGSRTPRTALRYAVERFPPSRRKRILEETKSG